MFLRRTAASSVTFRFMHPRARALLLTPLLLLPSCAEAGKGKDDPSSAAPVAASTTVQDPTARDYVSPRLPRGRVVLKDEQGQAHTVEVEIAATHAARVRGLMWRTELKDGQGMLFVFPNETTQSFYMKNTFIPLDILFLSSAGEIVTLVERVTPHSLTSRLSTKPAKYVLEVPGGWAQQKGIRVGTKAELQGTSMLNVE